MTTTPFLYKARQKDAVSARDPNHSMLNPRTKGMAEAGHAAVAEPFKGISTDGKILPGIIPLGQTGCSTEAMRVAAQEYLASLDPSQREHATFDIAGDDWRRWSNVHMFLMRHGVCMEEMTMAQRDAALLLMQESLSPAGYESARNIMKLNETIRELTGRDIEFGEWPYWVSIFGTPSATEPWGWQVDGHHLIINCFVVGDQIVMTPVFMGSEPTHATTGKYAGVGVFDEEDRNGLALAQSLDAGQRAKAVLATELPDEVFAVAFRDNLELGYAGLRFDSLSAGQKQLATKLMQTYICRVRDGHSDLWMKQVEKHLDSTYFAWMGGFGEEDVFYYRIHSPVVLIEFDHLKGIALENDFPTREHVHTVVRTPNGGDYGRDLLRQHYEQSSHHQR